MSFAERFPRDRLGLLYSRRINFTIESISRIASRLISMNRSGRLEVILEPKGYDLGLRTIDA